MKKITNLLSMVLLMLCMGLTSCDDILGQFDNPFGPLSISVNSIDLDADEMTLTVGDVGQLIATVGPENATDKTVTWTSSKESVATVDATGKVTAVAEGTATIKAKAGSISATCIVTVKAATVAVTGVTLDKTELAMTIGDADVQLNVTVTPANATNADVDWESNDLSVATVDGAGIVHAVADGTATITAKAGGKTATCTVTVSKALAVTTFSELNTALSAGKNVKLMNDIDCTAEIEITSNGALTIDGNGKKLSTTSEIRAFKVGSSATVAFKDLTLTEFVSGGGPAINNSGTIVLDGCTISNCHVNNSNGGGAIENKSSGKLYAINTTFSSNYSGEIGGAINNYMGSLYMSGCTFTDNYTTDSDAYYGGAIGINRGSEVRLINCSFSGNKYGTNTGTNDIGVYYKPTNYTIAGCTGATIASNDGDITPNTTGTATLNYSDLSNISFTYTAE